MDGLVISPFKVVCVVCPRNVACSEWMKGISKHKKQWISRTLTEGKCAGQVTNMGKWCWCYKKWTLNITG